MHARSTTFHGRPEQVDAGVTFLVDEVAPMLDGIEGCRGLSVIVDRDSGLCIATTSWDDEATMLASETQLRPARERGQEILGGSIDVDLWEIAMMHHPHHGACCRVSWVQGEDLDALVDAVRMSIMPQLDDMDGFSSMSLLVNRSTGIGCATTVWRDLAAMEATRTTADTMRAQAASAGGGTILDVHEFELAHAHLHVPEMA